VGGVRYGIRWLKVLIIEGANSSASYRLLRSRLIVSINFWQRLGDSGFCHFAFSFKELPMMKPSARFQYSEILLSVSPEPTQSSDDTAWRTFCNSTLSASLPVLEPVTITPSARKNSAASAMRAISISLVIA
jgi:hypothetical protein